MESVSPFTSVLKSAFLPFELVPVNSTNISESFVGKTYLHALHPEAFLAPHLIYLKIDFYSPLAPSFINSLTPFVKASHSFSNSLRYAFPLSVKR